MRLHVTSLERLLAQARHTIVNDSGAFTDHSIWPDEDREENTNLRPSSKSAVFQLHILKEPLLQNKRICMLTSMVRQHLMEPA
jgi:hypothetical protein